MPAVLDSSPHASPQAQLRHRVLSELRHQLSKTPPFNLWLAARRLKIKPVEVLAALGVLRVLNIVHFVADFGWALCESPPEAA